MHAAIVILLIALVFSIAIVVNILHYGIKFILRRRGYKVTLWYGGAGDLREAIANETEPATKLRYQKLLYAYYASLALFLLGGILLMLLSN